MHKEARAQVPLFDTYHTNGIFVSCVYLDIVTLFRGSLKINGVFWGTYRLSYRTFNF